MEPLNELQERQVRALLLELLGDYERRMMAHIERLAQAWQAQADRSIEQTREVVALGSELAGYLIEQKKREAR